MAQQGGTPRPSHAPSKVADSAIDYLLIALVQHYQHQDLGPPLQLALASIGFRIGRQLGERLTKDRPPMLEQLDIMKWVCKELWNEVFKKGIDNLRTNHRGTFVLRDTQFRWTQRLSQNLVSRPERASANELAADHIVLPCALIKGALAALGCDATVTADATTLPQCDFTVVIAQPQVQLQLNAAAQQSSTAGPRPSS